MVIKQLRLQRSWSQEQLAELSGLGLRTIQRIENSNRMSPGTLQALASIFDMDLTELERELSLDKNSYEWKKQPLWLRVLFFGTSRIRSNRKDMRNVELVGIFAGLLSLVAGACSAAGFLIPEDRAINLLFTGSMLFLVAYMMSVAARIADEHSVWPWIEPETD
jgi:transcriptional regulator with XRE-family HTH domain